MSGVTQEYNFYTVIFSTTFLAPRKEDEIRSMNHYRNYSDLKDQSFWVDGWVSSHHRENGSYTIYIVNSVDEIFNLSETDPEKRVNADQKRYLSKSVLKIEESSTTPFDALVIDYTVMPEVGSFISQKCNGISISSSLPYIDP